MDRYTYRGRRIDNFGWVYGTPIIFFRSKKEIEIITFDSILNRQKSCSIHASTLSQCTGITDKNMNFIFEGDIVGFDEGVISGKQTEFCRFEIKFGDWNCECGDLYCYEHGRGFFMYGYNGYHRTDGKSDRYKYERNIEITEKMQIIGNIHDNPELI